MDGFVSSRRRRTDHAGAAAASANEGSDWISQLPDCVLGAIVSLLDTEEGARTAVLSRRWRHVWRSAPLNLDDRLRFHYGDFQRLQVISQILTAHLGPARRLSLTSLHTPANVGRYDDWFPLPMFDGIQELVLHFPLTADHSTVPASALRYASLRVLDIGNCTFPASGWTPAFPCLTYLSLRCVGISEDLLHGMITNSPGIEALLLDTNFGHRRLCLSMPRLKYLAVLITRFERREEIEMDDLFIKDAPNLERLMLHEVNYGPSVRITGATKLKMLGYIGTGFPIIDLGGSIFKGMVPVSLVEQFGSVTILGLEMPEPNLKILIGYLRCFPRLEKLIVKFSVNIWTSSKRVTCCDALAPIECLDRSLKTIVLQSYEGLKRHVEFAKFFVERARVLEVMKFCSMKGCEKKWLQRQHWKLNIENRASRSAQFPFVCQYELPSTFWMDECFSREDPFIETN